MTNLNFAKISDLYLYNIYNLIKREPVGKTAVLQNFAQFGNIESYKNKLLMNDIKRAPPTDINQQVQTTSLPFKVLEL